MLHDFYRQGEEAAFHFDPQDMMKKGHDFKDDICPDSMEKNSDYLKLGEKYCRVLFLKDYASYIKDSMVTELTDFNRNMMLSIDIVPVPTDEAVREVENRLLGVETNITNWQRRQNANNNFSAVVPYDMELQRKESKEFLDDLTTRDQRMMFAVITMVITADDKKQLDSDTETVLSVARKHMCQLAVLKFQQFDGLNTVLPIGTRKINAFRTLTTESLAVFIPFKVQEVQDKGGIYFGDDAIVTVALSQVGNVGGEPYWSWYGFESRVEWCACFVSWCANECGYIDSGVVPKFSGCVGGVQWFKDREQWLDGSAEPASGMIIFFDWNNKGASGPQDGQSDHVGIVEKVENGIVYTVEGNSGDTCRQNQYPVGHYEILGYGVLSP